MKSVISGYTNNSSLYEDMKKSCYFVACFDESLNLVIQTSEMDILIRFFNKSKNLVESRYWNSKFLGHGTAADVEREFWKVYGGVGSIKNV